jgi:D-glycero-D-manno-heptose 1,7-bisphosphate phosphatase
MNKSVFFDRDGIINKALVKNNKPYSPLTVKEFKFTDYIKLGCEALERAGFFLFIVTNQPEISRGNLQQNELNLINLLIYQTLPVKEILVCPHSHEDLCSCRKPSAKMISDAANSYNIDLKNSWLIGDRWKDIDCGFKAGCKTIFVDYNYDEILKEKPNFIVSSVSSAINIILEESKKRP